MQHYLLIYNRRAGEIVRRQQFQTPGTALTARFEAEREFATSQTLRSWS